MWTVETSHVCFCGFFLSLKENLVQGSLKEWTQVFHAHTQWSWTSSFSHSLDNRRDESFFYCACFLFTFMHKELSLPQVTVSHSHSLLHYSRLDRTDTELCWQTLIGWISFMLLSPDQDWILRQVRFHINRVAFRNRSGFIRLCVWSTTDVVNRPA